MRPFTLLILLSLALLTSGCGGCESRDHSAQPADTLSTLVMQIRKCSRLYTTEYRVHKIVTFDDEMRLQGKMLTKRYNLKLPVGDRKVAIPMDATLKAYIDFADFNENNVSRTSDGKVVVTLPDPRIVLTESKIDQAGIREYVSFTRAHFSDRELSEYERQGRDAIMDHIPRLGIVDGARESAARQIIPLLVSMGFSEENVVVEFRHDLDRNSLRTLMDTNGLER